MLKIFKNIFLGENMKSKMNPSTNKTGKLPIIMDISTRMKTESHNQHATDKLKTKIANKETYSEKK